MRVLDVNCPAFNIAGIPAPRRVNLANHASAAKRARQAVKRRLVNRIRKGAMRTAIKKVHAAIEAGDRKTAEEALKTAIPLIDRAGQNNVIHRRQASRRVSRLVAHVKGMSA